MQNFPISIITKEVPKDGVFIGDCPDEILRIIFLNAPYGTSLVDIAIVHERFKRVALPELYKSIRLRANYTSDIHYSSTRWHELPACLVSDPKGLLLWNFSRACPHVQKLSLKVMDTKWYTNATGHQRLLEFLPGIKELTLDPPPRKYDFPVSDQLTTMRLNLRDSFALFQNPKIWPAYFDLKEFLSKPSLRKLQFDCENYRLHYKTIHTGNTRSSTIVDLRLINWHPEDVHVLSTVLPSIKSLKHFVIDVDGQWMDLPSSLWRRPMQILTPHDYGQLLQLHNASLEQIVIAYRSDVYTNGQDPRRASPAMGSLFSYSRLKRLAVPEHFIGTGKDFRFHRLLPPNLEELQVQITGVRDWHENDDDDDVREEMKYYRFRIEALAEYKNKFVPRLERVVLWIQMLEGHSFFDNNYVYTLNDIRGSEHLYKHQFSRDFEGHMVEIAEAFQKVNVRFEVVLARHFKRTPFAEYLYL